MPRGVKGSGKPRVTKSIETKIAEVDAVIKELQAKLKEAKAKKKELVNQKNKDELTQLQKVIAKSGISSDKLKEFIDNNK